MQDEHFIRDWSESHDAFSAGVTGMLSKVSRSDEPVSRRGTELRYAHANRLFEAIIAGVIAGLLVASAALTIDPVPARPGTAVEAAQHRLALQ
jgi:hypothetical protein